MKRFEIPIGIFIFKRGDKASQIIDQISQIKPLKIYLIGDGPRNEQENAAVEICRKQVESHITWDCEVVRYYAQTNRGVYENIAGGAKWVLEREESAIFLEDDNFPEITFFSYCEDMLNKYRDDGRVLWVCGTNYLAEYNPIDGSDYVFTQLMLPCGWASWAHKFSKFYDGKLELFRDKSVLSKVKYSYKNKTLYRQNLRSWNLENSRIMNNIKPISWDFQMAFSLRVHNMVGIAPKYNQIKNIGDDSFSMHGHSSMKNTMTQRFCYIETKKLTFPLIHPKTVLVDPIFEAKTEKVIIQPFIMRVKSTVGPIIRRLVFNDENKSITKTLKGIVGKK